MTKKSTATKLERLTTAVSRSTPEPSLAAAVVHLLDRYASGAPAPDDADRAVARVIEKRGISREMLAAFVADYKRVPAAVRSRVTPPALLKAKRETSLSQVFNRPSITLTRKAPLAEPPSQERGQLVAPPPVSGAVEVRRPPLAQLGKATRLRRLAPLVPWPYLQDIAEPDHSYGWGDTITLTGRFPGAASDPGSYRAFTIVRWLDNEPIVTELDLTAREETELQVRLDSTRRGGWSPAVWVTRTLSGETYTSHQLPLLLEETPAHTPEPLPTRIDSITPPDRYAGDRVMLSGLNLHTAPLEWTLLDSDAAPILLQPTALSSSEVEVRLPRTLPGGNYRVRSVGAFAVGVPSNVVVYAVRAYRFRIDLASLVCADETNPELGSDDIVTLWATVGDGDVYSGTTGTLGFGEDGDRRDFLPGAYTLYALGAAAEVRASLLAHIKMFEWDQEDVAAAQRYMGMVGDLAEELAPLLVEIPIAAIIASAVALLADLASWIISWNGNDLIAEHNWSWTIEDLLTLTNNPAGAFTKTQAFYGEGGHYDLTFKVSRVR